MPWTPYGGPRARPPAGQLLLPLGFINEIHEPPAVLSAARAFVEREGGIIPTTWHENGLGLHGELPGNLDYPIYLVNGLNAANFSAGGISDGRQDGNKAKAERFALTGRLDWHPILGSSLGFSFYRGNSVYQSSPDVPIDATTIPTFLKEVHAEFKAKVRQFRGLCARTRLGSAEMASLDLAASAPAVGTRQWGSYLEAGYDLLSRSGSRQALIPFLRWERLNLQQQVASGVFSVRANDQTAHIAGLSWNPSPRWRPAPPGGRAWPGPTGSAPPPSCWPISAIWPCGAGSPPVALWQSARRADRRGVDSC
jgi:hypothetical protein